MNTARRPDLSLRERERGGATTRLDRLRSRRRLRALVVAVAAAVVVAVATDLALGGIAGALAALLALVAAILGWALLRSLTRLVADLPDETLDERQLALRDRVYLDAYRIVAGVAILCGTLAVLVLPALAPGREWTPDDALTVLNGTIALFLVTPSAVLAWNLADDTEEG